MESFPLSNFLKKATMWAILKLSYQRKGQQHIIWHSLELDTFVEFVSQKNLLNKNHYLSLYITCILHYDIFDYSILPLNKSMNFIVNNRFEPSGGNTRAGQTRNAPLTH